MQAQSDPTARNIKVRVRYIVHSFFDRDGMAKQKDQAIDGEVPATRSREKSRHRLVVPIDPKIARCDLLDQSESIPRSVGPFLWK